MFTKTRNNLIGAITEFVNRKDFFSLPYRARLSFLSLLFGVNDYLVMSHEELILRSHFDYLGYGDQPRLKKMEMFKHQDFFKQLGINPNCAISAVNNLVALRLLKRISIADSQCDFPATELIDSETTLEKAIDIIHLGFY